MNMITKLKLNSYSTSFIPWILISRTMAECFAWDSSGTLSWMIYEAATNLKGYLDYLNNSQELAFIRQLTVYLVSEREQ